MDLTIFWSQFAERKLVTIFDYYKKVAGVKVSRKIATAIVDSTINLKHSPYIGAREELLSDRPQGFRYFVVKNYKSIYSINNDLNRIVIANVFDARQNPIKLRETKD